MAADPSHTMFPNDAPLQGFQPRHTPPAQPDDDAAATLFPADAARPQRPAQAPQRPAPSDADAAAAIFKTEPAPKVDTSSATDFFEGLATSAEADGLTEQALALRDAGDALAEDFANAGTDPGELHDVFRLMREAQSNLVGGAMSAERIAATRTAAMEVLTDEGITPNDLAVAHRLIQHMEQIAPGTIASLNATGAGNDVRLIRKAVAEARRRGL